jgi:hypothetical protein
VETVLELSGTDVAFSDCSRRSQNHCLCRPATRPKWLPGSIFGLIRAGALKPGLVRNEPGADAHRAADVAQSAFAEAFAVWDRIVPACTRHVGSGW